MEPAGRTARTAGADTSEGIESSFAPLHKRSGAKRRYASLRLDSCWRKRPPVHTAPSTAGMSRHQAAGGSGDRGAAVPRTADAAKPAAGHIPHLGGARQARVYARLRYYGTPAEEGGDGKVY